MCVMIAVLIVDIIQLCAIVKDAGSLKNIWVTLNVLVLLIRGEPIVIVEEFRDLKRSLFAKIIKIIIR